MAKSKSGFIKALVVLMIIPVVLISLPTCVLLVGGMLPTLTALLIDRSPDKWAVRTVGGINFSGVLPYAIPLWSGGHTIEDAIKVLSNPFSMLIIYGAAMIGWFMYVSMPPVIGAFLSMAAQRRIGVLREEQGKLTDEWGDEIASS